MTTEAIGEQHDSPLPTPPLGEAAALVARLLSGCNPHATSDESAPASTADAPKPEPAAPFDSEPIPPGTPTLVLTYDHNAAPSAPTAAPALPYSKTALWSMIVVFAAVVFGAGLAVGYGILNRHAKSASSVQGTSPSAFQSAALSEASPEPPNGPASIPLALNPGTVKPKSNLSQSTQASLTEGNAQPRSANGSESAQAQPSQQRSQETEQPQSVIGTAPTPPVSPDSDKSLASTEADGRHDAISAEPASVPLASAASVGNTKPVETAAQSPDPKSSATNTMHSESVLPPITVPASARAASAGGGSALANANTPPNGPAQPPTQSSVASLGNVDPCQLIHSVQPVYPEKARQLHVEGNVELRVVVGTDGAVRSVGLVSGPPLLVMAAMDAAREFRYKPASLNGQPIETVQTIDMSFDLKN